VPIISKITTQKKNIERFNIYIKRDGKDVYAFSVDQDILINYGLRKGVEIDDKEINEVLYKDDIKKAHNLALHYLSYRMRSVFEISDYLKKKEYETPIIEEVIAKLKSYNYLNDEEFAKAFVRSKKNTSIKGPKIIRNELKEKGVSESNIEIGLKEYTYGEQLEKAKVFAEKFIAKDKKRSQKELKDKVGQAILIKGFSSEIVAEVFQEVTVEKTSQEEKDALEYHGRKAHRKYSGYEGWEYERRMKSYLLRKRFSYDAINEFLQLLKEEN
jgi:regulatory protein